MVDRFFSLWALVIPMTSVVLVPSIKGTLPSYILAVLSFFLGVHNYKNYSIKLLFKILLAFVFMVLVGQFCLLSCGEFLPNLILVDVKDLKTVEFRTTLITQGIYLLPCVLTFIYTKSFYKTSWDKWIFAGGTVLALYGIYEWGYFLATGENGDFLSNRWFGDDSSVMSGSLFQQINLGGFVVQRLKSLVGEPSMYAYSMLAYWIYALHSGKKKLAWLYFCTLLLSTSTSAFVGMLMYGFYRLFKYGEARNVIKVLLVIIISTVLFYDIIYDFVDKMILAKVYMENLSGQERGGNILDALDVFADSPLAIKLFGWGWGTVRSTDFFSTLLINTGMVGFVLWTSSVLYPCLKEEKSYRFDGLKAILIIEYVIMMISVSEFSYLFYWMFLGVAYNTVENARNHIENK